MKVRLVKPVKHDLNSRSSVFTPVSSISKTERLSGKYLVKFCRIPEFYQIPVSGSGTSLLILHVDLGPIPGGAFTPYHPGILRNFPCNLRVDEN